MAGVIDRLLLSKVEEVLRGTRILWRTTRGRTNCSSGRGKRPASSEGTDRPGSAMERGRALKDRFVRAAWSGHVLRQQR